jgi:hypothetical protein
VSEMNAQDYYQLYRKKTIEAGFVPIGRQRFAGIIKTISLIPETIKYINEKQANDTESKDVKLPIPNVSGSLAADIRNKLSPVKNLCAMLKNREVDPYMERNDKLNDLVDSEIEKTLNVVEWLSSL